MSCLTTSPTRRSRMVALAVRTASAAASSHETVLVPMMSITLYTLIRAPNIVTHRRASRRRLAGSYPPRAGVCGESLNGGRPGIHLLVAGHVRMVIEQVGAAHGLRDHPGGVHHRDPGWLYRSEHRQAVA